MKQPKWTPLAILGCTAPLSGRPMPSHADDFPLGDVLSDAKLYFRARARDWNLSVTPSQYGGVKLAFNMIVN